MPSPSSTPFASLVARMPRALRSRLDTLQRDVAMIRAGLTGTRPPPFSRRATSTASLLAPRRVRVVEIVRETADSVSLRLVDVDGTRFRFLPGQFLTVLLTIDGEPVRRAYSISSEAGDVDSVTITAKRVPNGRGSRWLNEAVAVGDVLSVLGPSGSFTIVPDEDAARDVVLLGGGSGVTPLMSIARTLLARERRSVVRLVLGNRSADDVIFARALAELAAAHPERFVVRHVFGSVLDRAALARELDAFGAPVVPTWYYLCGPAPMMEEARAALAVRGVAPSAIHEERFTNPNAGPRAATATAKVTLRLHRSTHAITVAAGQTLLEAGLAAGVAMPFSCAIGGCGACKVKVAEGVVAMDEPNCLTDEERTAGCALACVGHPSDGAVIHVGEVG